MSPVQRAVADVGSIERRSVSCVYRYYHVAAFIGRTGNRRDALLLLPM